MSVLAHCVCARGESEVWVRVVGGCRMWVCVGVREHASMSVSSGAHNLLQSTFRPGEEENAVIWKGGSGTNR